MPQIQSPLAYGQWTAGAQIPSSASLTLLTDLQLAKALVHHEYVLTLPTDWWIHPDTQRPTACTVRAVQYEKLEGIVYLRCHFLDPVDMRQEGMQLQLPMSHYAPIEQWNIRQYFNVAFATAHTLADVGISSTETAAVSAALTKAWAQLLPSALTWTQSTPPSSSDRRSTH
eukprot:1728295-Rhodomonas_salina.1